MTLICTDDQIVVGRVSTKQAANPKDVVGALWIPIPAIYLGVIMVRQGRLQALHLHQVLNVGWTHLHAMIVVSQELIRKVARVVDVVGFQLSQILPMFLGVLSKGTHPRLHRLRRPHQHLQLQLQRHHLHLQFQRHHLHPLHHRHLDLCQNAMSFIQISVKVM